MNDSPVDHLLARLSGVKASGENWTARCPAHDDQENSLSIGAGDDGRALLKCFAGCSVDQIVSTLKLEMHDLFPAQSSGRARAITTNDLARDKQLPPEFLSSLGLEDRTDGVVIPYRLADGSLAPRQRLRTALTAKDGSIWLFGKGKPVSYGLDRLGQARAAGHLVLVEGESDCWTLWFHGLPALGIPGADMTSKLEVAQLTGIKRLYAVQEPDRGGQTFIRGLAKRLRDRGWGGETLVVNCGEAKDPNGLHKADPAAFKVAFQLFLDSATPLAKPEESPDPPENDQASEVEALLRESGFSRLGFNPSPALVGSVLREVAQLLGDADPLRRAVVRETLVQKLGALGIRSPARLVDAALGTVVAQGEDNLQGRTLILTEPTPSAQPVDGGELVQEIVHVLERHVVLAHGAAIAVAFWVLHAYALAATYISPFLTIVSPDKRCGKTTLLDVISAMVPRKLPASNISPAALYRVVEQHEPTLLVDEADTFLVRNEDLRGILNAGHTRSTAIVIRTVGDDHEPRQFSTWCPKLLAMIGRPSATIEDRSIVVPMRRRARAEKIQRLRRDRIDQEFEPLRARAARWVADHLELLRGAEPAVPEDLSDRAQDNWRPLLAIADAIGGEWPERAREAARLLSGAAAEGDQSAAVQLLADIKATFEEEEAEQLSSELIVAALVKLEDRPWPEWNKGKPLSKAAMARLLRPFSIKPRTIRSGMETPKGYRLQDFDDAFARYLPPSVPQQPQHPIGINNLDEDSNRNISGDVADARPNPTHREQTDVAGVAVADPVLRQPGLFERNTEGSAEGTEVFDL